MEKYNPQEIEKKWQKKWEKQKLFKTPEDVTPENKFYILPQLPYPSGSGLHVGHAEVYTACDIYARYQRMKGKKVLQVIGWDSFGLPAENYAIKTNVHPRKSTQDAVNNFRSQIKSLGISVDWDREVGSHNPDYYKWTQWFFLLFYKRGLAYRKKQAVNWCDSCKTVLANDQVKEGHCERCDTLIVQREMEQWYIKITDYAERLLNDIDKLDWPEETKKRQKDWIGRSEGTEVDFRLQTSDFRQEKKITVFTTRPDTLFGATYMVLAPEHAVVRELKSEVKNWDEVEKYIETTSKKTELDRQVQKEKTGVELKGIKAINPANNEEIPIFVADYVLATYGTGAIMAVPAHDERDFEFAKKYDLEIKPVLIEYQATDKQEQTLKTYNENLGKYIEGTPDVVDGVFKELIDKFFVLKDKDAKIFEIGTGTGRDADYIESLGYHVQRSDAVDSFIKYGEKKGKKVFKLDLFNDVSPYNAYDVIFANGVLHHFSYEQFDSIIKNISLSLRDNGLFIFTLKKGEGDAMLREKLGDERYFKFWQEESVEKILKNCGFRIEHMASVLEDKWIHIVAEKIQDAPLVLNGFSINSGFLNGLSTQEVKEKIIQWLEEKGIGKRKVQYKLRDWSVSRQRFWGAPIPMLINEQRVINDEQKEFPDFVVDIHAWGSSPKDHYHSWLNAELQKINIPVVTPEMPDADNPILDAWLNTLQGHLDKVTSCAVVVGRSLSCWAALKLAEKNKLRKLVLLAPTLPTDVWYRNIKQYCESDKQYSLLKEFVGSGMDFDKVKENVDEIVVLLSTNDPYIDLTDAEHFFEQYFPEARIIRVRDAGHFDAKHGYNTFPMLLNEILRPVRIDLRPLSQSDLPVVLPDDVDFKPTGQSPLTYSDDFQKGVEKKYGKGWKREPDTLDTFMCSSWYYYRYLDPRNDKEFASPENLKKWMPVDFYLGGPEHVNGHLLYSRFFTKVLYDAGYIDFDEPFKVHRHQGLILGPDNRKMSKRWGNVINPTDIVNEFGADTMRMYEMFMGPLEEDKPWDTNGVRGIRRFLEKVWNLQEKVIEAEAKSSSLTTLVHQTIKKVGEDLESLKFNTAIAMLMQFTNVLLKEEKISEAGYSVLIKLLSPFAPHMAEELWHILGNKDNVVTQPWPVYDPELIKEDTITLAIQINGKLRDAITVSSDISEEGAKTVALKSEKVQKWLEGKQPKKIIYVKGKLVSIVV